MELLLYHVPLQHFHYLAVAELITKNLQEFKDSIIIIIYYINTFKHFTTVSS